MISNRLHWLAARFHLQAQGIEMEPLRPAVIADVLKDLAEQAEALEAAARPFRLPVQRVEIPGGHGNVVHLLRPVAARDGAARDGAA